MTNQGLWSASQGGWLLAVCLFVSECSPHVRTPPPKPRDLKTPRWPQPPRTRDLISSRESYICLRSCCGSFAENCEDDESTQKPHRQIYKVLAREVPYPEPWNPQALELAETTPQSLGSQPPRASEASPDKESRKQLRGYQSTMEKVLLGKVCIRRYYRHV